MSVGASKFDRLPKTLASVRDFNAGKGILIFLVGVLLYFGHSAFIPAALALLAGLILSSPVEMLFRLGLPRGIGALLILVMTLTAAAGLIALVWTPSQQWYASAPHTLATIQKKVTPVAMLVTRIEELTNRASQVAAVPTAAQSAPVAVAVAQESAPRVLLATIRDSAMGLAAFVIHYALPIGGRPTDGGENDRGFF
jgi:predicted PurR-regulated permease PerM